MNITRDNIESYIPQRRPFIVVDNLLEATPQNFESNFLITEENIFNKNNVFQEAGLIENIAQTCAAAFGYLQRATHAEPRIGFIGAITKLEVLCLPNANQLINTLVSVSFQLENVFLIKGENFCNGNKLLRCEMKIVIT